MDSIHGQVHGVLSELVEFQTVDLHHQIEGGALGFFGETHADLSIHIRHDHLSILISQSHPKLVVPLLDPVEPHAGDDGTVGHGIRSFSGGDGIEGSQNADLAAVVHGRVTEGKDFKFQRTQYGSPVDLGKASD